MNTLLSLMNSIEQEARTIYDSYDAKKKALADKKEEELKQLFLEYEQETQLLLEAKREVFFEANRQEQKASKKRLATQQLALHAILEEHKLTVVRELVDKVVETYDH
ncbi:TPA: hypothetical protein ACQNX3_001248 [Streptococcus pyogenes]|uniref:hypothetical protein n=1 Tax=Streptococcus pyogenes TaxID=1314 RepID=UPI0004EF5381|nr:hypothetical protein [Streptococcus pyogenes]AIL11507.1 hypothetical protein DP15_1204 [Streptococcus pyogenes]KAB1892044.1 hypothetical protein F8173_04415 [Streptococcus pyogenes]ONG55583.1 hypothetical protein BKN22_00300 [Streptococcus pyogenes]QQA64365.1 hypothetical protein JAN99_00840 [Streptococcus pyogenes]SQF11794.1 V-type ATP synthase subunit G [Streptococcus pyogenes]